MRLIDADKLIEMIPTVMDMQDAYLPIHFKEWLIDSAPTIDAVSVVRCEDCKHREDCEQEVLLSEMCGEIEESARITYCSYGEREDE